jgi:hypothetical protein
VKACVRCLLPAAVPGSEIDNGGVCTPCRSFDRARESEDEEACRQREEDLEEALRSARGSGRYDVLVCLSGGKDSLYLLHRLKVDYGLRVLAFTTDANIPEVAWKSIRRAIRMLGVDHFVYRPPEGFYRKLFGHLLKNQEPRGAVYTVSYVYAPLFEGDALAAALEKGIPFVCAGYSPGQPEPARMVYEFSRRLIAETDWTPPGLRASGAFDEGELARFWNPKRYPIGTVFPRFLAPLHAWPYDQAEISRRVVTLGLVEKKAHANPIFSNYPVNWLLMYADLMRFGYNPYAPEFAALIRRGKASRSQWKIVAPILDAMIRHKVLLGREIVRQLNDLGLAEGELAVNQPLHAYDPKLP